ncbi:hypothetical protein COY95_02975 [Candidatus Woesearchaeota archaeon CG_4_10_14_0_8_um_filter_47_5]|nr:MAG: hypothetical protein COY95_02975 [Candidatus Woesearchaeota archaeon CG_4_10_14_0_8_um_filter_47_5]
MVKHLTAQDIMSKDYKVVNEDEDFKKARAFFDNKISVLVVFNGERAYKGILSERKVARLIPDPNKTKVGDILSNVPPIKRGTSFTECARLMLENWVMYLPVIEEGTLHGVVKNDTLLRAVSKLDLGQRRVADFIHPNVFVGSPHDSIGVVLQAFREFHISRMPIVEKEEVVGMITLRDINEDIVREKGALAPQTFLTESDYVLRKKVDSIMTPPITADENATISEIIEIMMEDELNSVIITEREERLAGIITRKDLLESIAALQKDAEELFISVSSKSSNPAKDKIKEIITDFAMRYPSKLRGSTLAVYLRRYHEKKGDQYLVYGRIRVSTPDKRYVARSASWGELNAVRQCLIRVEHQVTKELDLHEKEKRKKLLDYVDIESLS